MFKIGNKGLFAFVLTLLFITSNIVIAQEGGEGKKLFEAKCSTCHTPHRDMTGPALFHMRQQWEEAGAPAEAIYHWVHNWQAAAAKYPHAKEISKWSASTMNKFPDLSKDQINAIFDYVDAAPMPGSGGGSSPVASTGGATGAAATGEDSLGWGWYVLGIIFLVVIFAAGGFKRQLESVTGVDKSKKVGTKAWIFKNRKYLVLSSAIIFVGLITWGLLALYDIGVYKAYHPSQPIAFPHDVHAGTNDISCKYCHNSAYRSKTAGLPSVNVCMNCHKMVKGEGALAQREIAKIYDAAGFDPAGGGTYDGSKTHPIVWNKVHNLPDFVFFSHKQHVVVGGVDCKQCHGDMTKRHKTAEVVPVEELNKIDGNIKLSHPTLTMGWCIECHQKKEVSKGPLNTRDGYYTELHERLIKYDKPLYRKMLEDGKVTEKELGGWECSKCHY